MVEMNVFGTATEDFVEPLQKATLCFRERFEAPKDHSSLVNYFLNAKGFNARLISQFLMDHLIEVNNHPERFPHLLPDERAPVAEAALIPDI